MKKIIIPLTFFLIIFNINNCSKKILIKKEISKSLVKLGIDVLLEKRMNLLKDKRIGLITNQSGVTKDLIPTIEALYNEKSVNLVCLFSPEHGTRGNRKAGEFIESYIDEKTNLPVYSLYGKNKQPSEEAMNQIDALIFDIQDIGIRTYTYIYTMSYGMEAAARYNKEFIVLDRPNPLGGIKVEGNVLDTRFKSFIGRYPIAFRHGMTAGELALMFNREFGINCNLTVVEMEGWKRDMYFNQTGLHWIPPSPHIPHSETALHYAATGLIGELGTLSEGVGTATPFELVGAPWIDPFLFAHALNRKNLPGVYFYPVYFIPFYNKFQNTECGGVKLLITDRDKFLPFETAIFILESIKRLFSMHDIFSKNSRMFELAVGTDKIAQKINEKVSAENIIKSFQEELKTFKQKRKLYIIY